jgi:hypothetical protein
MPHTGFEVLEEVVYLKRLHLHTTAGAEASVPRSNPRIWSFCCAAAGASTAVPTAKKQRLKMRKKSIFNHLIIG